MTVAGVGFASPFLGAFRTEAARLACLMPARQGAIVWPPVRPLPFGARRREPVAAAGQFGRPAACRPLPGASRTRGAAAARDLAGLEARRPPADRRSQSPGPLVAHRHDPVRPWTSLQPRPARNAVDRRAVYARRLGRSALFSARTTSDCCCAWRPRSNASDRACRSASRASSWSRRGKRSWRQSAAASGSLDPPY